jgi:hypothetical protein
MTTARPAALTTGATSASPITVIRPLVTRLSNEYGLSAALLVLPPLIALYVLTSPSGTWGYVLLVHALISAVILLLSWGLHHTQVRISPDGLSETGLLGRPVFTPREEVASVLVLSITDGNSSAVHDQVFVLDENGRTRLRLRGQLWGPAAVQTVATAYDVPLQRLEDPKTMTDVRFDHASKLYWHERHPLLRALLLGTAIFCVLGPMLWFFQQLI